nr:unnamed protein product [Digitaria exilis]
MVPSSVPTRTASRKLVSSSCLLRYTTFHALLYSTTNSCSLDDGEAVEDEVAAATLRLSCGGRRMRKLVEHLQGELERVELCRDDEAMGEEGGVEGRERAMVENRATREEEEGVHRREETRAGLVDGEHHGRAACGRDGAEAADDHVRRRGVEAGGGLVEEEHAGVAEEGEPDGHAPPLAAGEARGGDPRVRDVRQPEVGEERRDVRLGRMRRARVEQRRGEREGLGDGEEGERDVRLGHVRREAAEGRGTERRGVEQQPPVRGRGACREDVEQRGLAGAAGAHDGEDLTGARRERHVAEDVVRWRQAGAAWPEGDETRERARRGRRLGVVDVPGGELW